MPNWTLPALLLIVATPTLVCAQGVTGQADSDVPPDWVQAPSRQQNPELWHCAGFGGSWVVNNHAGTIALTRWDPEAEKQPALPPHVKLSKKMIGGRSIQPTPNGWLIGFDAGEFGGGLWWFNRAGSKAIKLLPDNVHAIYQTSRGILILVGLAHMSLDYGAVYRYVDSERPTAVLLAKLNGSPEASTTAVDGGLIVAMSHGVSHVASDGRVRELYGTTECLTYPTSAAVNRNGDIYVAMRFFVLRLIRRNSEYTAQWLMPEQCTSTKLERNMCSCIGEGKEPN